MIRVNKTAQIPISLRLDNCTRYDGQDVQNVLISDQYGKCYLCEQETHKNYEIEHLRSKADEYFPELKFSWSNLFLTCGYCNGRKPNSSQIIDPSANNLEDMIIHRVDLYNKNVEFLINLTDINTNDTINLLDRLFNGKSRIRDKRGEILYEDLNREITYFLEKLLHYKSNPNEENKQIIIDLLHISKEFLGFKYWIIKDSGLLDQFKEFMIWNKLN